MSIVEIVFMLFQHISPTYIRFFKATFKGSTPNLGLSIGIYRVQPFNSMEFKKTGCSLIVFKYVALLQIYRIKMLRKIL